MTDFSEGETNLFRNLLHWIFSTNFFSFDLNVSINMSSKHAPVRS